MLNHCNLQRDRQKVGPGKSDLPLCHPAMFFLHSTKMSWSRWFAIEKSRAKHQLSLDPYEHRSIFDKSNLPRRLLPRTKILGNNILNQILGLSGMVLRWQRQLNLQSVQHRLPNRSIPRCRIMLNNTLGPSCKTAMLRSPSRNIDCNDSRPTWPRSNLTPTNCMDGWLRLATRCSTRRINLSNWPTPCSSSNKSSLQSELRSIHQLILFIRPCSCPSTRWRLTSQQILATPWDSTWRSLKRASPIRFLAALSDYLVLGLAVARCQLDLAFRLDFCSLVPSFGLSFSCFASSVSLLFRSTWLRCLTFPSWHPLVWTFILPHLVSQLFDGVRLCILALTQMGSFLWVSAIALDFARRKRLLCLLDLGSGTLRRPTWPLLRSDPLLGTFSSWLRNLIVDFASIWVLLLPLGPIVLGLEPGQGWQHCLTSLRQRSIFLTLVNVNVGVSWSPDTWLDLCPLPMLLSMGTPKARHGLKPWSSMRICFRFWLMRWSLVVSAHGWLVGTSMSPMMPWTCSKSGDNLDGRHHRILLFDAGVKKNSPLVSTLRNVTLFGCRLKLKHFVVVWMLLTSLQIIPLFRLGFLFALLCHVCLHGSSLLASLGIPLTIVGSSLLILLNGFKMHHLMLFGNNGLNPWKPVSTRR